MGQNVKTLPTSTRLLFGAPTLPPFPRNCSGPQKRGQCLSLRLRLKRRKTEPETKWRSTQKKEELYIQKVYRGL